VINSQDGQNTSTIRFCVTVVTNFLNYELVRGWGV